MPCDVYQYIFTNFVSWFGSTRARLNPDTPPIYVAFGARRLESLLKLTSHICVMIKSMRDLVHLSIMLNHFSMLVRVETGCHPVISAMYSSHPLLDAEGISESTAIR
jgi:hypothetical protein